MKKSTLSLCIAAACLLAGNAFAQTKGEADPEQSKAAPSTPTSKADKQAARKTRQAEGKQVAKTTDQHSDKPETTATHTKQTKEERKKANAERRARNKNVAKEPKVDKSPTE